MKSIITLITSLILLIPASGQGQWETTNVVLEVPIMRGEAAGDDGQMLKTKFASSSSVDRFMVVGDFHHYSPSPDFSQTMLYEFAIAAIEEEVDFIFFTGDLIVRGFDSPEKEDLVLKDWRFVLDTLYYHNIKVYACRGNNDVSSGKAWDSLFSGTMSFPQNGPEIEKNITYAVEYDNLLFISLDQYTDYHKINQVWLDDLLATTTREHIFAAGHEPAFKLLHTNCMGAFPEDRNQFWESLTDAGAKAFFCGHDHFYDHAIIDDGDGNPDNDIHQVITGTGGGGFHSDAIYDGDNGRWTPHRLFHEEEIGYVLVKVNGAELEMTWKHRIGQNIFGDGGDTFIFSPGTTNVQELQPGDEYLVNYPNPFQISTTITYQLLATSEVELSVYDISGRKVTTLVNERQLSERYEVEWNTEGMNPGIYFCELKTAQGSQVMKMVLID